MTHARDQEAERGRARPPAAGRRSPDRDDPLAQLARLIQKKGLKHSRQRDAITEVFFALGGHVPVETIVAKVRERDPRVSVATVYRTMKLLALCGLAVARQFGDGQTRYEPATRQHPDSHDHLICTSCGAIEEFESDRMAEIQERVARRHGFELERRRVELYGRCSGCQKGARRDEEPAA